jgi:hypothetical protein
MAICMAGGVAGGEDVSGDKWLDELGGDMIWHCVRVRLHMLSCWSMSSLQDSLKAVYAGWEQWWGGV